MVNCCAVTGCVNRSSRETQKSFFVLPSVLTNQGEATRLLSESRRLQWISNLKRSGFTPSKHTRICSDHFVSGKPSALYDTNSRDWAPTLNMGYVMSTSQLSVEKCERLKRRIQRKSSCEAAKLLLNFSRCLNEPQGEEAKNEDHDYVMAEALEAERSVSSVGTQTEPLEPSQEMIQKMRNEIQTLTSENMSLREELQKRKTTPDCLRDDDERVKFYSGLPSFCTLMTVFNLVSPFIKESSRSPMSKFEKFFMTLMKLKMDVPLQDLAYRYGVPLSTASNTFRNVVDVMHERLRPRSSDSVSDVLFEDKIVTVLCAVSDICESAVPST